MRVGKSKKIAEKLAYLMEVMRLNAAIGVRITAPSEFGLFAFDNNEVKAAANEFKLDMEKAHNDFSYDQSVIAVIAFCLADSDSDNDMDDDDDDMDEIPDVVSAAIGFCGKVYHEGNFESNPYIKNIHITETTVGERTLGMDYHLKYEPFLYSTHTDCTDNIVIPKLAVTDYQMNYPCIHSDSKSYISVEPYSISAYEPCVSEAEGSVLVLGCKMGYFPYMLSEKDNVTSVTVVENDPDIISLFQKCILPQFPKKDKIKIINADAFEYFHKIRDGQYDTCFVDLWNNSESCSVYLKALDTYGQFGITKTGYFAEPDILSTLVSYVQLIIIDTFLDKETIDDEDDDDDRYIIERLKKAYAGVKITKPLQVDYFSSITAMENLIRQS